MKNLFVFFTGVVLAAALAGCETVKGVGRDITNTSDAVQRSISRK